MGSVCKRGRRLSETAPTAPNASFAREGNFCVAYNGYLNKLSLSYKRTLTGTWRHGNVTGDFKVTRD